MPGRARTFIPTFLLCLALMHLAPPPRAHGLEDGNFVPMRHFTAYAVSNQHPLPPARDTEFLIVDSFDKFKQIFVLTRVMGDAPATVEEDLFDNNVLLAVIKEGLWDMQPLYAIHSPGQIDLHYSAEKQPAPFQAVTPLIVGVPKDLANSVRFVENGVTAGVVTPVDPLPLREADADIPIVGGWSGYREVGPEAAALFKVAMGQPAGARYEPLMHSSQLVNGMNHRFVCKQTLATRPPVLGIAIVSFHVSFDQKISRPEIQNIIR